MYSAWVGSFWERMIKTMKACIYKVIGRKLLDYFTFLTLLTDIKNSINSRPLTYKDNDLNFEPITPNHFLKFNIGEEILLGNLDGTEIELPNRKNIVKSLELREDLFDKFKNSWYEQYLLSLRETSRDLYQDGWTNKIAVGDVVLLSSPNKPCPMRSLGRVIELLPGRDGIVRFVKVRRPDKSEGVHSIKLLFPMELQVTPTRLRDPVEKEQEKHVNSENPRPRRNAARKCLEMLRKSN